MCGVHNAYLAEHDYGRQAMDRHRRSGTRASKAAPSDSTGSTSSQPPPTRRRAARLRPSGASAAASSPSALPSAGLQWDGSDSVAKRRRYLSQLASSRCG
jgi:hypothetical protein